MTVQDSVLTCRVKTYRLAKGWSQEELAEKVKVRRQAIYDIESGRYLPNTAIALRLARSFGCRVEDLFLEENPPECHPVHIPVATHGQSTRLALSRVRGRLVGIPLQGAESIPFGLRAADGFLAADGKSAQVFSTAHRLAQSIILMGCDPAFEILGHHVTRMAPEARVLCYFASSHRALWGLAEGRAHVAGTHLHNKDAIESNVAAAAQTLAGIRCRIVGFSFLEEGLMVAKNNPLGIQSVADLADPGVRFVNREPGAALRVLLDDQLACAGVPGSFIGGYGTEVVSHRDGAYRVACDAADAALGLRAVAEAFGLGFVPMASARCDLVIPMDMMSHPTVNILLDVLQSDLLRKEIAAIPGYDGAMTGKHIAEL